MNCKKSSIVSVAARDDVIPSQRENANDGPQVSHCSDLEVGVASDV